MVVESYLKYYFILHSFPYYYKIKQFFFCYPQGTKYTVSNVCEIFNLLIVKVCPAQANNGKKTVWRIRHDFSDPDPDFSDFSGFKFSDGSG